MVTSQDAKFGTTEATRKIGISAGRLRYWEKLGIVKPEYVQRGSRKFRKYCHEDIHRAVIIKTLTDTEKYTLEGAIRRLEQEGGV